MENNHQDYSLGSRPTARFVRSDLIALSREFSASLGSFYYPYFIIALETNLEDRKELQSLRALFSALDRKEFLPVFVHEFCHYLQSISTPNGIGQLLRLHALCAVTHGALHL